MTRKQKYSWSFLALGFLVSVMTGMRLALPDDKNSFILVDSIQWSMIISMTIGLIVGSMEAFSQLRWGKAIATSLAIATLSLLLFVVVIAALFPTLTHKIVVYNAFVLGWTVFGAILLGYKLVCHRRAKIIRIESYLYYN